jgi:hypothetical protein
MTSNPLLVAPPVTDREWVPFPGGELEAPRPKLRCPECRANRRTAASLARKTLCFQCYRTELDRERGIAAAAELNTASEIRFQTTLPFEPVDRMRLAQLRATRAVARSEASRGTGQFVDRRRRAQIAARQALQRLAAGLRGVQAPQSAPQYRVERLDVPAAWLPFVASR